MQFTIPKPVRYVLLVIFIVGGVYSFLQAKHLYLVHKEYDLYGILTILCILGILQTVGRLFIHPPGKNMGRREDLHHH